MVTQECAGYERRAYLPAKISSREIVFPRILRSFCLLVVGHSTIGCTRVRATHNDWRRSLARSIISLEIVRLVVAINYRPYDQSWPPTIDRTINRGILRPITSGVV